MYWPEEGGAGYGEFKVDITGKEEFPEFIIRKLVVSNFKASLIQFFCLSHKQQGVHNNIEL